MSAYLLALIAWVVVWSLIGLIMGPAGGKPGWLSRLNWLRFVRGQDGALSTSKLQFLLWTMAVMYAFLVVFIARRLVGLGLENISLDPNLFLVLGYSVTGAAAAAGITSTQVQNGTISKAGSSNLGPGALVTSDAGQPDIGKVQLLAWSLVAIGIFLYNVFFDPSVTGKDPQLPRLDQVLMVLIGLSQAAYLGNKLVASSSPRFFNAQPLAVGVCETVTVTGASLGTNGAGSTLMVDETAITDGSAQWNNTQVSFTMPGFKGDWSPWPLGIDLPIAAYVGGQNAVDSVSVQVESPRIDDFTPATLAVQGQLTVTGAALGTPSVVRPDANQVLLTGGGLTNPVALPSAWVRWRSTAITIIRLAAPLPAGLESNVDYEVEVVSYGHPVKAGPDSTVRFS